jgi:hypothetical protein
MLFTRHLIYHAPYVMVADFSNLSFSSKCLQTLLLFEKSNSFKFELGNTKEANTNPSYSTIPFGG